MAIKASDRRYQNTAEHHLSITGHLGNIKICDGICKFKFNLTCIDSCTALGLKGDVHTRYLWTMATRWDLEEDWASWRNQGSIVRLCLNANKNNAHVTHLRWRKGHITVHSYLVFHRLYKMLTHVTPKTKFYIMILDVYFTVHSIILTLMHDSCQDLSHSIKICFLPTDICLQSHRSPRELRNCCQLGIGAV